MHGGDGREQDREVNRDRYRKRSAGETNRTAQPRRHRRRHGKAADPGPGNGYDQYRARPGKAGNQDRNHRILLRARSAESPGVLLKLRSEEVQFSCDLFAGGASYLLYVGFELLPYTKGSFVPSKIVFGGCDSRVRKACLPCHMVSATKTTASG